MSIFRAVLEGAVIGVLGLVIINVFPLEISIFAVTMWLCKIGMAAVILWVFLHGPDLSGDGVDGTFGYNHGTADTGFEVRNSRR